MTEPIEAFPLAWPAGRPRSNRRENARFATSFAKARDKCRNEIALLGGSGVIVSTNMPLKRDGFPYAGAMSKLDDTGVAVYFTYKKRQMCFACDRWRSVADNMHAISLTIGALRGVARWGTGDMMEAAFTGFAALPPPGDTVGRSWRDILEMPAGDVDIDDARAQYRRLASFKHPDKAGGSHAAMAALNDAWRQAQEALK